MKGITIILGKLFDDTGSFSVRTPHMAIRASDILIGISFLVICLSFPPFDSSTQLIIVAKHLIYTHDTLACHYEIIKRNKTKERENQIYSFVYMRREKQPVKSKPMLNILNTRQKQNKSRCNTIHYRHTSSHVWCVREKTAVNVTVIMSKSICQKSGR